MFMISNTFIDSSLLIKTYKGNKVKFYNSLFSNAGIQFFINDIGLSEFIYFILGVHVHNVLFRSTMELSLVDQKKLNYMGSLILYIKSLFGLL